MYAPAATVAGFPELLCREFSLRNPDGEVPRTWYLGGGTPTLLGAEGLTRMAELFAPFFPVVGLEEWTIEANPADCSSAVIDAALKVGVNRISVGVQSFDDRLLADMGRRHTASVSRDLLRRLQSAGLDNFGIDLITGFPGETDESWLYTLEQALECAPKHISVYALSVEPHTVLSYRIGKGLVATPDDDQVMNRLKIATIMLNEAGYRRYEISNYALPGYECRHNLAVWHGEDYLGLGPAAASRFGDRRWTNAPDLKKYGGALASGEIPPAQSDIRLTPEEDAVERTLFRFRLGEGLDLTAAAAAFPVLADRLRAWDKVLRKLSAHGITEPIPNGWRLTPRGFEVCDAVLAELS